MTIRGSRLKHYSSGPYSVETTELVEQRRTMSGTGVIRCRPLKIETDQLERSPTAEVNGGKGVVERKMIRHTEEYVKKEYGNLSKHTRGTSNDNATHYCS